MDSAVSIERRLAAMKAFYLAGVRTTCFISPIFPGITDVKAIIRRAMSQCNLIWLENLNLRGDYKAVIMDYIQRKYPQLYPLYHEIYDRKDLSFWIALDKECKAFAAETGLGYVTNDDQLSRVFNAPPVIVNYFYHEQIRKNNRSGKPDDARKGAMRPGDACPAATAAEQKGECHAGGSSL